MKPAGGVDASLNAQTTVCLPRELLDRVRAEAARRVVGKSRIYTAAISEWLEQHEGEA